MKKTNKVLVALCIIVSILMIGVTCFAGDAGIVKPDDFEAKAPTNVDDFKDLGGKILGVAQTVGVLVSVVILLVLGIKYMMGSAEEKADYKKSMIPYVIGAIIIFAAPTIANIIYELASSLNKKAE